MMLSDNYDGATVGVVRVDNPKMTVDSVNVHYGARQVIHDVSLDVAQNEVLAMVGPCLLYTSDAADD